MGQAMILRALHDPSAFHSHIEIGALNILTLQLGKLRLKDIK